MAANGSVTDPLSNTSLDISEQCVNISMSKHDGRQSGASAIVEKRYCKNCRAEFAGPRCPMGHAEFACASRGAVQMPSLPHSTSLKKCMLLGGTKVGKFSV